MVPVDSKSETSKRSASLLVSSSRNSDRPNKFEERSNKKSKYGKKPFHDDDFANDSYSSNRRVSSSRPFKSSYNKKDFPPRRGDYRGRGGFRGRGGRGNRSYRNGLGHSETGGNDEMEEDLFAELDRSSSNTVLLKDQDSKKVINFKNIPKGPKSRSRNYPALGPSSLRHDKYVPSSSSPKNTTFSTSSANSQDSAQSHIIKKIKVTYHETTRTTPIFERVIQVGEGTYGKVYKAKNAVTGKFVALKRLRLEGEREGFPITAMREIRLLQSFNHANVVGLLEMMIEKRSIYMVFDYIDNDLTGILSHPEVKLSPANCKYLFKQLMEGIEYLHSKRVIHRDIKGSNILIDSGGNIKIADFGLARRMKDVRPNESPDYTNRVITLWYRPPELLMGATNYGREVDIWGIGCLLVEIFLKRAIFQGTEEINQLQLIFDIMGTPNMDTWPDIERLPWFELLRPKSRRPNRFQELFGDGKVLPTEACFDLAGKLLTLNPATRLVAKEALKHEYFSEDPQPESLSFLKKIGEWHELDAKKQRRKLRKQEEDRRKQSKQQQQQQQQSQQTKEVQSQKVKEISDAISSVHSDNGTAKDQETDAVPSIVEQSNEKDSEELVDSDEKMKDNENTKS